MGVRQATSPAHEAFAYWSAGEFAPPKRNKLAEVRLHGWTGDPDGAVPGPNDYLVVTSYAYRRLPRPKGMWTCPPASLSQIPDLQKIENPLHKAGVAQVR